MDLSQFIDPNIPVILAAISMTTLFLAIYLARPWLAGMIGNARIERELGRLKKKGATVMNHIQLATKAGDVIHIDHLVITNAQVIAITTLGYSGEIMGSVRASTWVQETAQGSQRIPNPLIHHQEIVRTIQSALGDRIKIRAISAFTAGNLSTDSKEIVQAAACAKAMHAAVESVTTGAKQQWAANILRNITLTNVDSKVEKERAFIARQGNESQLKNARTLMLTSLFFMLLAITLAGLRLAVGHGLI
jgi:hypothetical protein